MLSFESVKGYPPLDPPGNNPGAYSGGSQQVVGYYAPMAIERPDGSIYIINIGELVERHGGSSLARRT